MSETTSSELPSSGSDDISPSSEAGSIAVGPADSPPRKGPLSFLSGTLTCAVLGWFCLGLSRRVVAYYGAHPPHYGSAIAQTISTAIKTLLVGMCFLATFSFAFIGLGLFLVFIRSLIPEKAQSPS